VVEFPGSTSGALAPTFLLSGFAGAGFLVGLTFSYNGAAKAVAEIVGEFVEFGAAVDLDGLLGGVANHIAVVAPSQMILKLGFSTVVEDPVQVVCQLL
jgi:hypothetical protein